MKEKDIKTNEIMLEILKMYFSDCEIEALNNEQINEIKYGLENGLTYNQIKIYKNKNYTAQQMCEIRLGLQQGVDVKKYLNKNLHRNEMRRIRKLLYKNK